MTISEQFDDIAFELEGVLYDLEHQFNPHDGGVCARTIRQMLRKLKELEGDMIDETSGLKDA